MMVILYIFLLIVFPSLMCITITPYVARLAFEIRAVDAPGERKVHQTIMPRIGGVGIFISFTFIILISVISNYHGIFNNFKPKMLAFIVLSALMFLIGFLDDLKNLKPNVKFIMQLIVASMAYFSGFKVPIFMNYVVLNYFMTIFWIAGITNAINLIDGLDGLATGVSAISVAIITILAIIYSSPVLIFVSAMLLSCILGFLYYNFNPAKIFLGDCGSLYIGFLLSLLAIELSKQSGIKFNLILPVMVLALPIADTTTVMARRAYNQISVSGISIKLIFKSMFTADNGHIHHRLVKLGMSHKSAVLLLYCVAIIFGVMSIIIGTSTSTITLIGIAIICLLVFILFNKFTFNEIA